eukprot:COSAG02_NODE_110_length_36062_cov_85.812106_1_plen_75_part_00
MCRIRGEDKYFVVISDLQMYPDHLFLKVSCNLGTDSGLLDRCVDAPAAAGTCMYTQARSSEIETTVHGDCRELG